jgi:hypothetical protein
VIFQLVIWDEPCQGDVRSHTQLINQLFDAQAVRPPTAQYVTHPRDTADQLWQATENRVVTFVAFGACQASYGQDDRLRGSQPVAPQEIARLRRRGELFRHKSVGQQADLLIPQDQLTAKAIPGETADRPNSLGSA